MPKNDGRKLDHKTLEAIRIRAVEQVQAGQSPETVINALGFSSSCIYEWLSRYRSDGWHALRALPLNGRPRKVTGPQMKWIYETVTLKNPLQLKFEFALWTRGMIRILINERFGIHLSLASMGRLLAQREFRPIAMQVLAAGAIPVSEAIQYVCSQKGIKSILFGASTQSHIEQTFNLIKQYS